MQNIYGVICDSGDGSSHMQWFRNKELVDDILDEDHDDHELYYANEGEPSSILSFPDELNLEQCGFKFSDGSFLND